MNRRILNTFAVTIAFSAGAAIMALILDIGSVQAYLGMAAVPPGEMVREGLVYVGTAAFAGLLADGLRLFATTWSDGNWHLQDDMTDLFRSSLGPR